MTFFLQNSKPERIWNRDFYLHMFSSKKLINEFLKNKDETFLADPYKLHVFEWSGFTGDFCAS